MDKSVSIVRVDGRPYRTIARENWGLTREQMIGKHVHHRIKRSDGGTNDPSNLYVCSEWFHDNVWHYGDNGFAGLALTGSQKAHSKRDVDGKSLLGKQNAERLHRNKDEHGRSLRALRLNKTIHAEKDEEGKSLLGKRNATKNWHNEKDENGKDVKSQQRAREMNAQRWMCTETGFITSPGSLTHYQKSRGIDTANRVRVA